MDIFETPVYALGLSQRKNNAKEDLQCRAAYRLISQLDIVVYFRQKHRGTIKQLGTRLGCFLEKIWQQEDLFHESQRQQESVSAASS